MKVINFADAKAHRDGVLTPKFILEDALEDIENIKDVIILIRRKDGVITHGVSDMLFSEAIGICELGKTLFIDDMRKDDDY